MIARHVADIAQYRSKEKCKSLCQVNRRVASYLCQVKKRLKMAQRKTDMKTVLTVMRVLNELSDGQSEATPVSQGSSPGPSFLRLPASNNSSSSTVQGEIDLPSNLSMCGRVSVLYCTVLLVNIANGTLCLKCMHVLGVTRPEDILGKWKQLSLLQKSKFKQSVQGELKM